MKERIWAPWRGEYITATNKNDTECFLCDLVNVAPSSKNLLLYATENSMVVMNKYPYNNGHIMVVPKKHVNSFENLSEKEYKDLSDLLKLSTKVITDVFNPQGCNIGMNLGKVAGAGLDDHIHYHIVPRWNGDTNFMPVFTDIKVISEHIIVSYERILKGFMEVCK